MNNKYHSKMVKINIILILCTVATIVSSVLFFSLYKPGTPNADADEGIIKKFDQQKSEVIETFYMPIISRRLKQVKLEELKNEVVHQGETEIRVWIGFSNSGFRGLILKSDNTNGSAIYIPDPDFDKAQSPAQVFRLLSPPTKGWQELSTKLQQLGLYDLSGEPDRVPGRYMITDAVVAIVEIKTSNSYRTYKYDGLLYYQGEETKKMEKIIDILSYEFGINLY